MIKHNQDGAVNGIMISLVFSIILLLVVAVFAVWAFSSRQDFKNNVDAKIQVAVAASKVQSEASEKAQLAQDQKQPYLSYQGPYQYGSISFQYPRTWSVYMNTSAGGNTFIDGYFMPGMLTSVSDQTGDFALRVQVLGQTYTQSVQGVVGNGQNSAISSKAFSLKLVPSVVGVEATGALSVSQEGIGTMVILPDRTNTIEIWTDGTANLSDFNNVLSSFSFSP